MQSKSNMQIMPARLGLITSVTSMILQHKSPDRFDRDAYTLMEFGR